MTLPGENVLFQLFGVANVFPNPERTRKILNYIYRLYFLLILFYTPQGVIKLQYDVIKNGNIVLSTKVFIETVTYWLNLYVSYIQILYHDGKITRVKSSLKEMEGLFRMPRTMRRKHVFALWFVIMSILACQMTYYLQSMLLSDTGIVASMSYFLNKFTVNLINYQLCRLLWLIRYFYGEVNGRLRCLARKIKSGTNSSIMREVHHLKKCHTTLTCMTKTLSEAHSLHIFFNVISCLVESICSLTGLLFVRESCQGNVNCIYNDTSNSIFWYCNFSLPIFLLVFSCSWVKDEAEKTQKLVLDIELESRDEALISLLEDFSLNLRLIRFTFTGYGCFQVDKAMLLSNASTTLTYLIIQKQFAFDGLYTTYTGF